MKFSDYFEKYLKNEESIKRKEEILKIKDDIISNYNYMDKLIYSLDNNLYFMEYYNYFYTSIRDYLIDNYYYAFYDLDYIVIKYKDRFIKLEEDNYSYLFDSNIYINFNDIINKKENINKNKYIKSLNDLEEIKTILPKKLIKQKLDL